MLFAFSVMYGSLSNDEPSYERMDVQVGL